jgi:hypothetical protein
VYCRPGKPPEVFIKDLGLIQTETEKEFDRKSYDDLRCAIAISMKLQALAADADCVIAEIPSGSQSARASWALGIALGTLTAVLPHVLIRVTPRETKLAAVGLSDASKEEMIDWAVGLYPDAPWIRHRKKVVKTKCEHLADAIGVLHAGMAKREFKDIAKFFDGH